MIVVEGFDGSGKTTVAHAIANRLALAYVHAGSKPRDVMSSLEICHYRMSNPVVQDRVTQISEAVYGTLTRQDNAAKARARLSDLASAQLVVYCRPSDETILRNVLSHESKPHDVPEDVAQFTQNALLLIGRYDAIMEEASRYVDVRTYDYTTDNLTELINHCQGTIRE